MAHFEFDGEKYKKASRHQKEWGDKLIATLKFKGDESILDLGCGDGVLTERLKNLVPDGRVVGIDASQGMIETANLLKRDGLSFIRMNIDDLNFDGEFDLIYSNAALHWVLNHNQLLKNSLRALKPGGVIAWSFAADGTCVTFNKAVNEVMDDNAYKAYFNGFVWPWFMPSKEQYDSLASNIEFSEFNTEYQLMDRYFDNEDEMIKWIDQPSIVPFIVRIPDGKKEGFRKAVIDKILSTAKQPDGRCFEFFRRLFVSAKK